MRRAFQKHTKLWFGDEWNYPGEMMSMALKKPKETVVFISKMHVSLIYRSRERRMWRLILLGTNWDGFMLEIKI